MGGPVGLLALGLAVQDILATTADSGGFLLATRALHLRQQGRERWQAQFFQPSFLAVYDG